MNLWVHLTPFRMSFYCFAACDGNLLNLVAVRT